MRKECPADVLVGCPDVDGIDCVHPACDVSGECTTNDDCVEICRQPKFWATRGTGPKGNGHGNGKDDGDTETLLDMVLGDVGSIEVCGQTIDNSTDLGDLDSALEALCVQTRGIEERELFRALVTARLNCLVSEGGTCDDIVGRFTDVSIEDCDTLCTGDTVPGGPTIDECIDQLECFNEGGQVVEGDCALGTCEEDPTELCGADFGVCPDVVMLEDDDDGDEEESECVPFEGICADERLCTTDVDSELQICPRRLRPITQKVCQEARKNTCTIDSCED